MFRQKCLLVALIALTTFVSCFATEHPFSEGFEKKLESVESAEERTMNTRIDMEVAKKFSDPEYEEKQKRVTRGIMRQFLKQNHLESAVSEKDFEAAVDATYEDEKILFAKETKESMDLVFKESVEESLKAAQQQGIDPDTVSNLEVRLRQPGSVLSDQDVSDSVESLANEYLEIKSEEGVQTKKFGKIFKKIGGVVKKLAPIALKIAPFAMPGAGSLAGAAMKQVAKKAITKAVTKMCKACSKIVNIASSLKGGNIGGLIKNKLNGLKDKVVGKIKDKVNGLKDKVVGKIKGKFNELKDKVKGKLNGLKDKVKGKLNGLKDKVKGKLNGLKDKLKGKLNGLKDKVKGKFNELKDKVKGKLNGLKDKFLGGGQGEESSGPEETSGGGEQSAPEPQQAEEQPQQQQAEEQPQQQQAEEQPQPQQEQPQQQSQPQQEQPQQQSQPQQQQPQQQSQPQQQQPQYASQPQQQQPQYASQPQQQQPQYASQPQQQQPIEQLPAQAPVDPVEIKNEVQQAIQPVADEIERNREVIQRETANEKAEISRLQDEVKAVQSAQAQAAAPSHPSTLPGAIPNVVGNGVGPIAVNNGMFSSAAFQNPVTNGLYPSALPLGQPFTNPYLNVPAVPMFDDSLLAPQPIVSVQPVVIAGVFAPPRFRRFGEWANSLLSSRRVSLSQQLRLESRLLSILRRRRSAYFVVKRRLSGLSRGSRTYTILARSASQQLNRWKLAKLIYQIFRKKFSGSRSFF